MDSESDYMEEVGTDDEGLSYEEQMEESGDPDYYEDEMGMGLDEEMDMDGASEEYFAEDMGYDSDFQTDEQSMKGIIPYQNPIRVDSSHFFRTKQVFLSSDDLIEWVKRVGRQNGIVIVKSRSDLNDPNRAPRITLACERGGKYQERLNRKRSANSSAKKRKTSTKKCGCPFAIKAYITDRANMRWGLVVVNGMHNHPLIKCFEGHSYVGRLSKEEKETVERLSKSGMKSKDILNHLKLRDPTNVSTLRTIYNARISLRIHETAERSYT